MTKPSNLYNLKHAKMYSKLKHKILRMLHTNHVELKNRSVSPSIISSKYLNRNVSNQTPSFIKEWKQWLFQCVNVNVCGKNITGILIQIHMDHITLVSESDIYVIPIQHVTFICYRSH